MPRKKKETKRFVQCWRCAQLFELPYFVENEPLEFNERTECPACGKRGFLPTELPFDVPDTVVPEELLLHAIATIEDARRLNDLRDVEWPEDVTFLRPMINWGLDFYQGLLVRGRKEILVRALLKLLESSEDGMVTLSSATLRSYFLNR